MRHPLTLHLTFHLTALALCLAFAAPADAADKKPKPATQAPHTTTAWPGQPLLQREEVQTFARDVAERHGLPLPWVRSQLAQAAWVAPVRKFIMPPPAGTAKSWAAYRAIFIEPRRINAALDFWRTNAAWLQRAEERWGVPPEIVVAIIGVETFYGRISGGFRVLDALATLAFDFPPGRKDRSEFFRGELEQLLLLAHRERLDAASFKGSFAGAIGLPQFMPGSINRWAIDFDEDGHIDLRNNAADAIGSVAHYLAAFGWQKDLPTHYEVAVPVQASDRAFLLGPDIVPSFTPTQFTERGALLPDAALKHDGLLALVELQNGAAAPSYIAGTANFYTVTRYNWSSYYALAVIELGAAVARERKTSALKP
jgi:membrane-bound lytic murein transglycosylase B